MSELRQHRIARAWTLILLLTLAAVPAVRAQDEAPTEAPDGAPSDAPAARAELAFGTGIDRETRSLTGEATTFAVADFGGEEGQIWCLSRVLNLSAPSFVTHVWYHEGQTKAKVDLNVNSADWRTWSSKRIMPAWTGDWEVKVLDPDGMVLASQRFTIE